MTKEEFINIIKDIGCCDDDVSRRTMLTEMSDKVEKIFDDLTANSNTINTLNETISKNNEDMEKLRQANMSLFLRVGAEKTPSQIKEDTTGIKEENKEKRKFEDLFKKESEK